LSPVVFALHGHEALGHVIAERLGGEVGKLTLRRFPDGETYVRLETGVEGHPVILLCSMNDPDEESAQWVSEVSRGAGVPYAVLQKIRMGDRDVEVSVPDVQAWRNHTPVLVDDIISTGRTMIETLGAFAVRGNETSGVHRGARGVRGRRLQGLARRWARTRSHLQYHHSPIERHRLERSDCYRHRQPIAFGGEPLIGHSMLA